MDTKIDEFYAHEAMDRCHVLACMLDDHLIQHPYVQQDSDVRKLLCAASDAIGAAYQMIGGSRLPPNAIGQGSAACGASPAPTGCAAG